MTNVPGIISMAGGMPDSENLPFEEVKNIINQWDFSKARIGLQYGTTKGFPQLLSLISARMEQKKKILWHFILPLVVWGIIAIIAVLNPVTEEPEDLPPEAWSYYSGRSPLEQFLIKNRNIILVALFLCLITPGLILWMLGYK